MKWKFWEKEKKEYKRPNYYPKCTIYYTVLIKEEKIFNKDEYFDVSHIRYNINENNYCCDGFKKLFIHYNDIKIAGRNYLKNLNLKHHLVWKMKTYDQMDTPLSNKVPIWYCPFCGAKIELINNGILKKVKVACKEITEPEKVIPAKTKKVCKYKWQEI